MWINGPNQIKRRVAGFRGKLQEQANSLSVELVAGSFFANVRRLGPILRGAVIGESSTANHFIPPGW